MTKFVIQDKEAGNYIDCFLSEKEAQKVLEQYEEEDRKEGIYEKDFYEIVETYPKEFERVKRILDKKNI